MTVLYQWAVIQNDMNSNNSKNIFFSSMKDFQVHKMLLFIQNENSNSKIIEKTKCEILLIIIMWKDCIFAQIYMM